MLTATDELRHLVSTLSEAQAEAVLAALEEHCPELLEPAPRRVLQRADGKRSRRARRR